MYSLVVMMVLCLVDLIFVFRLATMAKWLKDYLSFGSKRIPPQPPKPDYTESEILKAYRVQKNLDFEDPYEDYESKSRNDSGSAETPLGGFGSVLKGTGLDTKAVSPKHRLIKVESQDLGRTKILLSSVSLEEPTEPVGRTGFEYNWELKA